MKLLLRPLAALALLMTAAGCASTPTRTVTVTSIPPQVAPSRETMRRTMEFRNAIDGLKLRGVGVFPAAFQGRIPPADVADLVVELGFNRLFCYITSETELNGFLDDLLEECARRQIQTEAVLIQDDFYRKRFGNQLIRPFLIQYPTLKEAVRKLIRFNDSLPEQERFAGLTVGIAPHRLDGRNVQRIHGNLYRWGDNNFGVGGDNDMLMREAVQMLREIAVLPGVPPLRIAIQDFYHELASEGKLSVGTIQDFLAISPRLLLINSGNRPTQLVTTVENELKSAPKGSSIVIAAQLAEHTSVSEGMLRRRDWNDLVRAMKYAISHYRSYPAFEGVVIAPLAIIEFLREEK